MSSNLFFISLLNGLSYGLLLFLLSAGLTLIFGMMRVLNLAHGSFYMLGAYLGYSATCLVGLNFWITLLCVPFLVGVLGYFTEKLLLRKIKGQGHLPELLLTYGVALVVLAIVQLVWGRAPVAYMVPEGLQGAAFTLFGFGFPLYRLVIMIIAGIVMGIMWVAFSKGTRARVLHAAAQNPAMLEALGYNVPQLMSFIFALSCALAALAGVLGGFAFVTEPAMAQSMGMLLFVVIVLGGMGSLVGAFIASLFIGVLYNLAVSWDVRLADIFGLNDLPLNSIWMLSSAQIAPLLPFMLMVLVLLLRPQGLLGRAA